MGMFSENTVDKGECGAEPQSEGAAADGDTETPCKIYLQT